MASRAPDWLTARPVAHRGLHDRAQGIIENMPSAIDAAIAGNFAIEVDLQLSADGEAMVHHDYELGRLTQGSGELLSLTADELKQVAFKHTPERMMTLSDLCERVDGRVPLVLEVKSRFNGDRKLVGRMAQILKSYRDPVVAMSFDPDQVVAIRELMPFVPRGIVAERHYEDERVEAASARQDPRHDGPAPRVQHATAFHRVLGQRSARTRSVDRPQHVRLRAADMDRAHPGATPARQAICRSDDL